MLVELRKTDVDVAGADALIAKARSNLTRGASTTRKPSSYSLKTSRGV